ncbi:MAG: putative peptide zinc metalloprotease protein [Frankiales bacterium]|nr:putative peptide zinc metalloprotease protein [Frankiales bacterium]
MRFAPDLEWRASKRGLLLAGPTLDALLLDHPRAACLPDLLRDDPDAQELATRLGDPDAPRLVAELTAAGVLVPSQDTPPTRAAVPHRAVVLTRSGAEVDGIATPARWLDRHVVPLLLSPPGRAVLLAVLLAGAVALLRGRPAGPHVSDTPTVDALVGLALGLLLSALHELAHAVALVHYGRAPRRAGIGFYWGSVSFYVDSSEALTLPRRARVVQALAGLAVDVVTLCLLALGAHLAESVLLVGVLWRLAVLGLVELAVNAAPVLEVDGHWALADLLDEPELGPRARTALGDVLRRRRRPQTPDWLVLYGTLSAVGGLVLLVGAAFVWWAAMSDLVSALTDGGPAEVAVAVLVAAPFAVSLVASSLGLLLDVLVPGDAGAAGS